jgi:ribosomal protein S18 acetylase RimI-like enzyme
MLVQPLAGALGLAWPPRVEPGADRAAVADALTAAACGWLRERGVRVCQAFGAPADRDDFAPLLHHDFRRVTQVTDMRRELDPFTPHEPARVELVPFDVNPDALIATLLLTYDGSLDAPELTGDRTHTEVVAGLRGNGLIGSDWWFHATREGEPVGVVMWEPSTDAGAMEVSYLGLVPTARGQGLGDELVRRSIAFAASRGFDALTLSVDVRNEPALRLYRRHGFRDLDRRDVYLAAW